MQHIIDKFIQDLVDELKRENKHREFIGERLLNIPYVISPLSQHLGNSKYLEFRLFNFEGGLNTKSCFDK